MKITLPANTPYYQAYGGCALCSTGKFLGAGAEVKIGQIVSLCYSHEDQDAVPFQLNGNEYYFLVHEIRINRLHAKLVRLANFTVVQ